MHEKAYDNNVKKIKHASKKLGEVREKIARYDAELKMSRAEAEMAQLAQSFDFDVTTDFGQIEQVLNDKIGLNRAKARVAADLSTEGLEEIERERSDGINHGGGCVAASTKSRWAWPLRKRRWSRRAPSNSGRVKPKRTNARLGSDISILF